MTNYHVVEGGDSIVARPLNGEYYEYEGFYVQVEHLDIALLKFNVAEVPYLHFGESAKMVEGQRVLVIGNPEGLEGTVSDGIVSAIRENGELIQITAPVSPGSSGSPVLNEDGQVIGVATLMFREGQNLNFAIATDAVALAESDWLRKNNPTPQTRNEGRTASGTTPKLSFDRGAAKFKARDYDGAIADFSQAIQSDPTFAAAYQRRGAARYYKRDFDGAIADFDQAIRLDPSDGWAHLGRGVAKSAKHDFNGAIADLDYAIELKPKFPEAYYYRGTANYAKNDYDPAIADFDKAIELDQKFVIAYFARAIAKAHSGDDDGAITDFNKAIEIDPKFTNAYNGRGRSKARKGNYDAAITDFNKAIQINPKDARTYYNRALIAQLKGDLIGALADFTRCVEIDEKQDYAHVRIWLLRVRRGQPDQANQQLSNYFDQRWDLSPVNWVSKVIGHLLDKITEAEFFAAASSSDPRKDREQHCEAWYYAGLKHLLVGDKRTAVDYFKKCLATKLTTFDEYQLAGSELKTLGSN